jgi:hypothetical protein
MNQDGVVPPQGGPARRPAGGPRGGARGPDTPAGPGGRRYPASAGQPGVHRSGAPFGPADLGDALRSSVAGIGAGGPPPGGLARVRRRARARQRTRGIVAGGATVLVLACGVALATGGRFGLTPGLIGARDAARPASAGPGGALPGQTPGAAGYSGQAVPDWPGVPGRLMATGPAIGPVAPLTGTPTAAAAADLPLCSAASLVTSTTLGAIVGPDVYGHVDAVAQAACVALGPPVVTVTNRAGTAAASVGIFREDTLDAPLLPDVPTWGRTLVLQPGQGYEFQFAWVPMACPQPTASASPGVPGTASADQAAYSFGYAVQGTTPSAVVDLTAPCNVELYVTDIYPTGAYPYPQPTAPSAVAAPPPPSAPPGSAPPSPTGSAPPGAPSTPAAPDPAASQSPAGAPGSDPDSAGAAGAAGASAPPTS